MGGQADMTPDSVSEDQIRRDNLSPVQVFTYMAVQTSTFRRIIKVAIGSSSTPVQYLVLTHRSFK